MPERTTAYALRDVIAEVLAEAYKAYDIDAACDGFGIPGREDAWTYNSKRVYVRNRLTGVQLAQMLEIARRILDEHPDEKLTAMVAGVGVRGVDGEMKKLIFAADGPKPRIVLADAVSNTIDIVEGADRCLIYDRPLSPIGLTWGELLAWWIETKRPQTTPEVSAGQLLYSRLAKSLSGDAEKVLFRTYCGRYARDDADSTPALIPQVYLHYDPYTAKELKTIDGRELARQRMDFLLLPNDRRRIVIEVDGRHHYAEKAYTEDEKPSPRLYSEMVAEDRRIRLDGYEVFRFGGYELSRPSARETVRVFFDRVLA